MDPARGVDTDRLRRDIDATRACISGTVSELRQKVGEAMQWQTHVERHPAPILGGAALVGLFVGRQLARRLTANGRRRAGHGWKSGETGTADFVPIPARVETAGAAHLTAASASWQRLGSRVEALMNRVIDEVADAAERAIVPVLVGGVETLFEGRRARGVHRPAARDGVSVSPPREGRLT